MNASKALIIVSSTALLASFAAAKHIRVGPGPRYDFNTIQAAINAAHPGDDIQVAAGTYAEQLTIGAGKNNIGLQSENAVIAPPTTMTSGFLVNINGAQNVGLQGFTLQGPLPDAAFSGGSKAGGIYVQGGGSALIANNYITQMWQATPSFRGIQNGIGILVGRQLDGTTGSAAIVNNTIDHWQKGAIVIDNSGSQGLVFNNTLIGEGPINYTAQNGVQVGDGANAVVANNNIGGLSYTPATYASSGILVFSTSNVYVMNNHITACDLGVAFADVTQSEISNNHISDGLYGIDVDEFSTGSQMNEIDHNESKNNSQEGIYVSVDSIKNLFDHNQFKNNGYVDAEDDSVGTGTAGTGNTWTHNDLKTSIPAGLQAK